MPTISEILVVRSLKMSGYGKSQVNNGFHSPIPSLPTSVSHLDIQFIPPRDMSSAPHQLSTIYL